MIKIAIDAMGGDNAPDAIIRGTTKALKSNTDIEIYLYGKKDLIDKAIKNENVSNDIINRINIVNCMDVIGFNESPTVAIKTKKDSSIVVACNDLKQGKVDAIVSAGSSGALLVCGTLIVGRIKGIERPAFGIIVPSEMGNFLLVDCGANADCKPNYINQFALIGSVYYREMFNKENPVVKLLNIGTEEEKGNLLIKEASDLLKQNTNINYNGYAESRDAIFGSCDVLVSDGFSGNIFLKTYEGTAKFILKNLKQVFKKNIFTILGYLLIKSNFKGLINKFDYKKHGGAPILGLNKIIIKVHGNTDGDEIQYAINQAQSFVQNNVNDRIINNIKE